MPPKMVRRRTVTRYSPELGEKICAELAEGRDLRSICADDGMPVPGIVFRWLAAHAEFRARYCRAREAGGGTRYTPELGQWICNEIAEGGTLRSICGEHAMPDILNVFVWVAQHAEFRALFARARQVQAETLFDEMLDIADDTGRRANGVQDAKLRIDLRKWMVSKLNPRKYGDKIELAGEAEAPVTFKVVREIILPKKKEEDQ